MKQTNIKKFKADKFLPETELLIERGELKTAEPCCKLTMVVYDNLKTKLFLQGNDTIINNHGFEQTATKEWTLKCYNNKQVDNLIKYYSNIF